MSKRYSKPQILTVSKATAAIQGNKQDLAAIDGNRTTVSGYEDNE